MKRDSGAIYRAMNRGDRREAIVRDDRTWEMFLETVAGAHTRADWEVHPGASWIAGKARWTWQPSGRRIAEGADRTTLAGGSDDDLAMDS
jgi:hypothetical protein